MFRHHLALSFYIFTCNYIVIYDMLLLSLNVNYIMYT